MGVGSPHKRATLPPEQLIAEQTFARKPHGCGAFRLVYIPCPCPPAGMVSSSRSSMCCGSWPAGSRGRSVGQAPVKLVLDASVAVAAAASDVDRQG